MKCWVPGHPGCAVDCPEQSCIAYYREPNGPCYARCAGQFSSEKLDLSGRFSMSIRGVPGGRLSAIFDDVLPPALAFVMEQSEEEANIELHDATLVDLLWEFRAIYKIDLEPERGPEVSA